MLTDNNRNRGRAGITLAIAYFGANGFTVSIPITDTQWYDLIIEKDGVISTVQCKCTGTKDNAISLRSMGGTKGVSYDNVLNHPVTYLFCVANDGTLFNIPVSKIRESDIKSCIYLRSTKVKRGFDTSEYMVQI